MVNFGKFSSENTVTFDDFSPKITVVRPKYVHRGSIQEWGSIEADTVLKKLLYTVGWNRQEAVKKNGCTSR